jgi:hypothetical protein
MSRKRNLWGESAVLNTQTYRYYLERLMELSISMFDWKNVPDSIDTRFLETVLFNNGSAVFFYDEDLNIRTGLSNQLQDGGTYLVLPVAMSGNFDVYNIPTDRRAYASNGYNKKLNQNNSVIIYNNMVRTNSRLMCKLYANRLWDIDRTIDINAKAQKTPVLIQCDETQRLTLQNLYEQYSGNIPFIMGDKNLDISSVKVLKTDAPYMGDKLYDLKSQIWNEALTYLGISNVNFMKKERMVSDEVIRNQGGTIASRYSRLQSRRNAADMINKMFGLNIEVDYREDYRQVDDKLPIVYPNDTEDGKVHQIADEVKE